MEFIDYYKKLLEEGEELLSMEIDELLAYRRELKNVLNVARDCLKEQQPIDKNIIDRASELKEAISITKEHINYLNEENYYIKIIIDSRENYSEMRNSSSKKQEPIIIPFKKPDNKPNKPRDL